ncbi:hypothetical protein BD770DRAFT_375681 [Pilaira anomala]|nr:hypothetical protein BD770DRAFT_375681 [Pilaira anomala]
MTSLATLIYYPRSIGLLANGIFAGLGVTLNCVGVPAIMASRDPLPSFIKTYNNASKIAISSILVGTAANAVCYYSTKRTKYLFVAVLTFFSAPFTVFFIAPVNKELFALENWVKTMIVTRYQDF